MHSAGMILTKAGYDILGSGMFADVWAKAGESTVLKLFNSDDLGYMSFLKLVMKHQSPHFPKFKGSFLKINDEYLAVRMEKLSPIVGIEAVNVAEVIHGYLSLKIDRDLEAKLHGFEDPMDNEPGYKMMIEYNKKQPGLKDACDYLADNVAALDGGLDIHSENIMSRNGVWVITDPIA